MGIGETLVRTVTAAEPEQVLELHPRPYLVVERCVGQVNEKHIGCDNRSTIHIPVVQSMKSIIFENIRNYILGKKKQLTG